MVTSSPGGIGGFLARLKSAGRGSEIASSRKARAAADEVARTTATAARALGASARGTSGSCIPWSTLASSYPTHVLHGQVEPSSVSVYDDTGRGVSFPMSKQDLLWPARTSGRRSRLLHSIEAMTEGNYRNTDEVLRALGMAH